MFIKQKRHQRTDKSLNQNAYCGFLICKYMDNFSVARLSVSVCVMVTLAETASDVYLTWTCLQRTEVSNILEVLWW